MDMHNAGTVDDDVWGDTKPELSNPTPKEAKQVIEFIPKYTMTDAELRQIVVEHINTREVEQAKDEVLLYEAAFPIGSNSATNAEKELILTRVAIRQQRINALVEAHNNQFGDM